jgi:DNA modification methylase
LIELNKFYCADSVEFMQECIPDNFVDLTVTSPPYDNLRTYKGYEFNYQSMIKELYRVTKDGGMVVWVVGDATIKGNETGTSFKQALYFKEIGFNLNDTMIYQKMNGAMGTIYTYLQEFEYMFVFSKGYPKSVNLLRDRKNVEHRERTTPVKKSNKEGRCEERKTLIREEYGRRKNIWAYPVGGKQKIGYHPAPFPEKLAQDHILSWSNEEDVVLDPMCGSGTTCKMAWINKRNFIGIDMSEEYIDEICIPRLSKYGWIN